MAPSETEELVAIDHNELTLLMIEAFGEVERPPNQSADELMALLRTHDDAKTASFERAARAAVDYIAQCVGADIKEIRVTYIKPEPGKEN